MTAWATAAVLACVAVTLAARSPDAAVGPDAAQYLRAARILVDQGTWLQPDVTPSGTSPFAVWPPGYPALVAVPVALGLDPWWASKLVGALSLLACVPLLQRLAPERLVPMVHVLGVASVLWLFAWSASEGPFLVALVALAAALTAHARAPTWRTALGAAVAATAAFYLRYLGAIGVVALVVGAAGTAWRRRPGAAGLAVAAGTTALLDGAWLLRNALATGHLTGQGRLPAPEGWTSLGVDLVRAGLAELILGARHLSTAPWVLAAVVAAGTIQLLGVLLALRAVGWRRPALDAAWAWPAGLGALHLGALVTLRFTYHFDRFGWRLLGPGTALLALAAVVAAGGLGPAVRRRLDATLALSVLAGVVVALATPAPQGIATASTTLARTVARYAEVPPGCVVAPHDVALPWLRPDLVPVTPHHTPYDREAESVPAFLLRVADTPWTCLRLDVRDDLDPRRFDPSWSALAAEHPVGSLQVVR
ncbi:MAG: hypothetical protein H6733_07480 [Alphaproteobacteria bacterium]|nr:hypothetical protein [Alphaproteobacteria bacterium]